MIGIFPVNDGQGNYSYMQVLVPGAEDRVYYHAKSPATRTAGSYYNEKPLPVFTIRTEKEAWTNPFITIFEPFCGEDQNSVKAVEKIAGLSNANNTVLRVAHENGSEQVIFQGNDAGISINNTQLGFSGHFGVASLKEGKLKHLYLGKGSHIRYGEITLKAHNGTTSAELEIIDDNRYRVSCNKPVIVEISGPGSKSAELKMGESDQNIIGLRIGNGMKFMIPDLDDVKLVF